MAVDGERRKEKKDRPMIRDKRQEIKETRDKRKGTRDKSRRRRRSRSRRRRRSIGVHGMGRAAEDGNTRAQASGGRGELNVARVLLVGEASHPEGDEVIFTEFKEDLRGDQLGFKRGRVD